MDNQELTVEQVAAQKKWQDDIEVFNKGLKKLIQDTKVTVVPKIRYDENGSRAYLRLERVETPPEAAPAARAPKAAKKVVKKNGKKAE